MALNEELIGFVKDGLQRGLPRVQIHDVLLHAGWPQDQVRRAMGGFAEIEFPIPVPRPVPSVSVRETFVYGVMFTTLVLSAYSLGLLLFALIDRSFPHTASLRPQIVSQTIRWSISALVVTFPVFLYVARAIDRAVRLDPTKRASRVRRQVTYLTLFITACVLIGDLIAAVYNFLGGDVTASFVLKALTVGLIAGGVFSYYRWDLGPGEEEPET